MKILKDINYNTILNKTLNKILIYNGNFYPISQVDIKNGGCTINNKVVNLVDRKLFDIELVKKIYPEVFL